MYDYYIEEKYGDEEDMDEHGPVNLNEVKPDQLKQGHKWDQGKPDWSFLPSAPMEQILKVYAGGAAKYGRGNYQKGILFSRVFSAAMRHLWAWWRCEDKDEESGLSHLAHAAWNVLTLLEFVTRYKDYEKFDDRVVAKPDPVNAWPTTVTVDPCIHEWAEQSRIETTGGVAVTMRCLKCSLYQIANLPPINVGMPTTICQSPFVQHVPKDTGEEILGMRVFVSSSVPPGTIQFIDKQGNNLGHIKVNTEEAK